MTILIAYPDINAINIDEDRIDVDLSSLIFPSAVSRVKRPINSGYSINGILGVNKISPSLLKSHSPLYLLSDSETEATLGRDFFLFS